MEDEFIDQFLDLLSESFENEPDIDIDIDAALGDYTNISEQQIDVASGQASENTDNIEAIISHNFRQTIPSSQISFVANHWDDNAVRFFDKCREYGVDAEASLGRHPNGGLCSGDKSSISVTLDHAKDAGKITDAQYNELKPLLNRS